MTFFQGKIAIVTGGGSGIGQGLGLALAEQGATVILTDINPERARTAAASGPSGRLIPSALDVTDSRAVQNLVDDTVAQYGRLDYMFNNAGIAVAGEVQDLSLEDWRCVLDVNLNGVINGLAAAYPVMVRQGFGHIVNTGSIEGLLPFPSSAGYAASKHAVVGLSGSLRIEGADLGVKVSVVCPGYIKTAIFHDCKMVRLDREKTLQSLSRLKGLTPNQCAKAILKGVRRNQGIIVVTGTARFLWWLQRLSPRLVSYIMIRHHRRARAEAHLET
jgi:NAD(P)-dependent dehydrogenase (short-subunit alcohol dehydrogenase family)